MAKSEDAKAKALELAIGQIDKQFGKGAIMRLGDSNVNMEIQVIPTGALSLDAALGIGGVPRGRVIEIYGPEASGKTTLSLHIMAETQKLGGKVAFIDAEHALDPRYAAKLGVNTDDLLLSQPDSGEQALEITETLVRSNAIDTIVIDSVAALVPRAELEGEMGDSHMGLQARLMSQALRKLAGIIKKSNTCVIFINQIRMKIGVMFSAYPDAFLSINYTRYLGTFCPKEYVLKLVHPRIYEQQRRIVGRHNGSGGNNFMSFPFKKFKKFLSYLVYRLHFYSNLKLSYSVMTSRIASQRNPRLLRKSICLFISFCSNASW